jgi:hypothetical protein
MDTNELSKHIERLNQLRQRESEQQRIAALAKIKELRKKWQGSPTTQKHGS